MLATFLEQEHPFYSCFIRFCILSFVILTLYFIHVFIINPIFFYFRSYSEIDLQNLGLFHVDYYKFYFVLLQLD